MASPGRVGRKLSDPAALVAMQAEDTIQRPAVPELLVLDVTALLPEEAAQAIVQHVDRLGALGLLRPATDQHYAFGPCQS